MGLSHEWVHAKRFKPCRRKDASDANQLTGSGGYDPMRDGGHVGRRLVRSNSMPPHPLAALHPLHDLKSRALNNPHFKRVSQPPHFQGEGGHATRLFCGSFRDRRPSVRTPRGAKSEARPATTAVSPTLSAAPSPMQAMLRAPGSSQPGSMTPQDCHLVSSHGMILGCALGHPLA